jgi:hypothetical protein
LAGLNGIVLAMIPYTHATPLGPFSAAFVLPRSGLIFSAAIMKMRDRISTRDGPILQAVVRPSRV